VRELRVELESPPITPCRLCGSSALRLWLQPAPQGTLSQPSGFSIYRCQDCELLQTRPEPSASEWSAAYGPAYTWQTRTDGVARLEAWYRRALLRLDQYARCALPYGWQVAAPFSTSVAATVC